MVIVEDSDIVLEVMSEEWKVFGVWCEWCEMVVREVVLVVSDGEEERMKWLVCVYCVMKKRKEVCG
jgi:hypothetical protein